jgi:hypothetical protein
LDSKEANYSGDSGEQSRRSQESGNRDRDRPDRRSGRGFLAGVGIWGLYRLPLLAAGLVHLVLGK